MVRDDVEAENTGSYIAETVSQEVAKSGLGQGVNNALSHFDTYYLRSVVVFEDINSSRQRSRSRSSSSAAGQ